MSLGDNDTLVCDFCSDISREVVYEYRTQKAPYTVAGIEVNDDGRWAACALCAYLIETHQPQALLDEAIESCIAGRSIAPAPVDGLRKGVGSVHGFFYEHKLPGRLLVIDNERSDPVTDREMTERIEDLAALLGLS